MANYAVIQHLPRYRAHIYPPGIGYQHRLNNQNRNDGPTSDTGVRVGKNDFFRIKLIFFSNKSDFDLFDFFSTFSTTSYEIICNSENKYVE